MGSVTAPIGGGSSDGENHVYVGAGFFGNRWADPPNYNPADPTGHPSYFNGDIAEVAFYPHQLTGADASAQWAAAQHSPA